MKLKEKFQRFWTLSKSGKGFTLVELIVVIAILAILAGVAIPVYNGYIKRANSAADQQLLDTVNTAFTAACLEEGIAMESLTSSTAVMPIVDGKVYMDGVMPEAIRDEFAFYFGENVDAAFDTFESLVYDAAKRAFAGSEDGNNVTVNFGNTSLSISKDLINLLNNSGFIKYDGLGTDTLVGKLEGVTDLAQILVGPNATGNSADLMNSVFESDDFLSFMGNALGADLSTTEGQNKVAEEFLNQGVTMEQLKANAAVLYASKNAASMKQDDVIAMLTTGNAKQTILDSMKAGNTTEALSQAALAYGMYTSFAHSSYGSDEAKGKDEYGAMNDLNNAKFIEYMNSDAGKADLAGYVAALNMVNSTADNSDAISKLLVNGFGDSDLLDAINGALGSK